MTEFLDSVTTSSGKVIKPGDKVRFDTRSNLGVRADVVRACFMQTILLQPYAANEVQPALVLTDYSWCFADDVID